MADDSRPIGIFDSGVGGLTVFRELSRHLPEESLVYLGDTARVPYGSKSRDTVIRYANACAQLLLKQDVKLLVVACNTASAFALDALKSTLSVPVVGVVEPGAYAALSRTKNNHIGVIGTVGTVASKAYTQAILHLRHNAAVYTQACPLFVPLAEEGWTTGDVPRLVAKNYLEPLLMRGIDTLVLGCTHYPLLASVIQETVGIGVTLVDSAEETARTVADVVKNHNLACSPGQIPQYRFLVSDAPENFLKTSRHFLKQVSAPVEWVDF